MHNYPDADVLWKECTMCSTTLSAMRALLKSRSVNVHDCLIVKNAAEDTWYFCQHLKWKQLYGDIYTEVLQGITSNGPTAVAANEAIETNEGVCEERKRKRNRLSENQAGKAKKATTRPVAKQPLILAHRSLHEHGSTSPFSGRFTWSWGVC